MWYKKSQQHRWHVLSLLLVYNTARMVCYTFLYKNSERNTFCKIKIIYSRTKRETHRVTTLNSAGIQILMKIVPIFVFLRGWKHVRSQSPDSQTAYQTKIIYPRSHSIFEPTTLDTTTLTSQSQIRHLSVVHKSTITATHNRKAMNLNHVLRIEKFNIHSRTLRRLLQTIRTPLTPSPLINEPHIKPLT